MRKIFLLCLIGLCSCVQNKDNMEVVDDVVRSVKVSISPLEEEINSRMEYTADNKRLWELNDTIGIFPSKGGQVEFPILPKNVGTSLANFDGGGWGLKSSYTYSAYYPYNFYNRDGKKIPFSYIGQVQDGSGTRGHLSNYLLGIAEPSTASNSGLIFNLSHMGAVFILNLTLPEDKIYTSLYIYADSEVIPVKKTFNLLEIGVPEDVTLNRNHLKIDLKNITTEASTEVVVYVAFPSVAQETKMLKAVVTDSQGYKYVGDISRVSMKDGSYNFYLNVAKGKYYRLKASPVLTDGFNGGIEDWVTDGIDYGGVAN